MKTSNSASTALRRRELLAGAAMLVFSATTVRAATITGQLPWTPNAGNPPSRIKLGPWEFFTGEEGRTMEALADRIIPTDAETPGGKESGCAIFVDRQLAGSYGRQEGLYLRPPFQTGTRNQGHQSEKSPAQEYREGLAALDRACKGAFGESFADVPDKDLVLKG